MMDISKRRLHKLASLALAGIVSVYILLTLKNTPSERLQKTSISYWFPSAPPTHNSDLVPSALINDSISNDTSSTPSTSDSKIATTDDVLWEAPLESSAALPSDKLIPAPAVNGQRSSIGKVTILFGEKNPI